MKMVCRRSKTCEEECCDKEPHDQDMACSWSCGSHPDSTCVPVPVSSEVAAERERIADGVRAWLRSTISDYELCLILGISPYDWNILIREKQANWDSYIGSLVDCCDNPNCKVKQALL